MPKYNCLPEVSAEYDQFQEEVESSAGDSGRSGFESSLAIPEPLRHEEPSDYIRDLNLAKQQNLVISTQRQKLLGTKSSITFYRSREKELLSYLCQPQKLVYCKDIERVVLKMGVPQY